MQQVIQYAQLNRWLVAHFRTVRIARADGSFYFATPVQADGAGFPDLILVRGAELIVAELKVGKNEASPEQCYWLDAFRETGCAAGVWRPDDLPLIHKALT